MLHTMLENQSLEASRMASTFMDFFKWLPVILVARF